ncbi:SDR family NAD(P)-dependent oxidoreductase [Streptosporangium oxazolinicum]|uniref:SDR family NAD(P)-dependent oxidoreductase n=1 Tax=Streptosporangium oxazolinicum TaxID=909287 RepID=A0ABP8AM33_9ACTN
MSARPNLGAGRAVLITGASSGLGEACALFLARAGFQVFAGVRKQADGERLRRTATGVLIPVTIDVTDEDCVADAARTVTGRLTGSGLWGLVNNAGICVPSPLAWLEPGQLRRQLDTNVVGTLTVTRAFLPSLRNGGGRIVNVTSGLGRVAVPFLGAYVASQFAKEGFSDVLRRELAPLGIAVCVVRPGAIVTPIWDKVTADGHRAVSAGDPYHREPFLRFLDSNAETARASKTTSLDFTRAVLRALTSRRPRRHYPVGRDATAAGLVSRFLPTALLDRQFAAVVTPPGSADGAT